MLVLAIYAVAVFALCFISIGLLRRKFAALLMVALWTLLGPILMQVCNFLLVGYLDPFWIWASTVQAAVALVASLFALGVKAAFERGEETK